MYSIYKYNAIPKDDSFRLFVLEPGTDKQLLRGILHNSKLNRAPYFEAISYVWGSPDRSVELICDNENILITTSLSDVLHRVRLPDRPRTLWADSICINQADLDEKGFQVFLMESIYRRSNRTLIRIGAHDDGHGEPILGLLTDIDQKIFANLQQEWNSAPAIEEGRPLAHDIRWRSFQYLTNAPWFRRGWVVQDAAHARDAVVFWGDHEFFWTTIMRAFIWAMMHAHHILDKFDINISSLHYYCFSVLKKDKIQPLVREKWWNSKGKILDTLDGGRTFSLADPRDRIFAFQDLPTSDNSHNLQIIPSYCKSFFEVCKDSALTNLDVCNNLDLLLYVLHGEGSLARDCPSWVQLWGHIKSPHLIHRSFVDQAPLLQKQKPKLSFCDPGNGLLLSGLRFVKTYGPKCMGPGRLWFKKKKDCQDLAAFALEIFKTARGTAKHAINYKRWKMQATGGDAEWFLRHRVQMAAHSKRFIVTDRGYGMAPRLAQEEDECVIIRGGKMPFLLRNVDGVGNYKLVGCISHSSDYQQKFGDTRLYMNIGLETGKDWTNWDIEEERICLL